MQIGSGTQPRTDAVLPTAIRVAGYAKAGHLAGAQAEDELLHRLQALQAELQADVEEQEHNSQLRQVPHAFHVPDDA